MNYKKLDSRVTYSLCISQFATSSFSAWNRWISQWLNNILIDGIVPGVAGLFLSILIGNAGTTFMHPTLATDLRAY